MKIIIADDKTVIEFEPEETLKLINPDSPENLKLLIESIAKVRKDQVEAEILIQKEKTKLDLELAEKLKVLESTKTE